MPRVYSTGDKIKGNSNNYIIVKFLNAGNFANSYEAKDNGGRRIFLKQYIDPTPASGREYIDFKEHQNKAKTILDKLDVVEKNYEYFEFDNCYFQAKEFMEGKDLDSALNDPKNPPTDEQRFFIATVFMYGIRKIHEEGIVHTDLKPQQIYLKFNPSITLKYEVKIVDFDFCRIPGISEPIHIAGTPFYTSPEHIKGETPDFKSDIFTCGIILYQILGGTEPHPGTTQEEFQHNVLAYRVEKKLKELNPQISNELSELIYRMLDPQKENRPDAKEVHDALIRELDSLRKGISMPTAPPPSPPVTKVPIRIEFHHPLVKYPLSVHKTMILGRDNFRSYGEGYKYLERQQFEIIKHGDCWKIKGFPSTTNPTLCDDKDCSGVEIELKDGSKIKIGNLEITIKFVYS